MDESIRKRGAPSLEVTDEQRAKIRRLSGFGTPIREIASIIEISPTSLYKHYREDLIRGKAEANMEVVNSLYEACIEGNVKAQIYWTKCRCGWKKDNDPENDYEPENQKIKMMTNCLIPARREREDV